MGTSVSLFNWLTTLRGFLSPYPSKIFMSHKGNGETDFLMRGQLFILTYAFILLTHSINHTFTRTFINSLTHSFKLMMMKMMILMLMMLILLMSMISLIGMMMSMSMMSGVRQLKCVNLSVYNNLSICVCMEVCRMYRILIKSSSDLDDDDDVVITVVT